jgi:hypothetical protein
MNAIKDGGPAFPMPIAGCNDGGVYNTLEQSRGELGGMTLRDYFATHASEADIEASRIAGGNPDDPRIRCFARYRHADAMLRAREVQS